MLPNVVHATVVHPRYDIRVLFKECASLARAGIGTISLFVADGKGDETWNGVQIHDVGKPGFGRIGRAIGGSVRMWKALRRARPNLVQIHNPELLPLALLLRATGTAVIFDMHENLPQQILTKDWVNPLARPLISRLARWGQLLTCRHIPTIFAETSYAKDFPSAKEGIVVLNYPMLDVLSGITRTKRRRFTIGYIGGLSLQRGALTMLAVISRLRDQGVEVDGVFVGPVSDEPAVVRALEDGISNGWITATGHLKSREGWERMAECHVGMAVLRPSPNYLESYPTKMFEYMALGIPVIVSDFPLWRAVVDDARCGILVDPTDVGAVAAAVRWIHDNPIDANRMGLRGRDAVVRYSWDSEFAKLRSLYERILQATGASGLAEAPRTT